MPSRAKPRTPAAKKHRSTTAKPQPGQPVVLSPDEVAGLQNSYEAWQHAQLTAHQAQMSAVFLHEAYVARITAIRDRYLLTPQYEVDFATRVATPIEGDGRG